MNTYQELDRFNHVAGYAKGQVDEWIRETDAELEALRKRARMRADGVMGSTQASMRVGQNQTRGNAKDAWERFEAAVRRRKEEAERLHDLQQLNDGGDLDPVVPSGNWFEETHNAHR
jgi:hypothetical protein